MPETPPGPTSTPTASQEEQAEELDQAATPAQTSAAPRREPPQAAAGIASSQAEQRATPANSGGTANDTQPVTSSNAASPADNGTNNAQDTPSGHQPATPTASTKETGHIPPSSPPVSDGQVSPPVPAGFTPYTQYRGPDGRLYKQPSIPESPRKDGTKAQSAAVLKPDVARTYGESGSGSGSGTGDSQAVNLGITGLSDIPKAWGELPGSVSLSAAIEWVQQNRLYVVKETPGRGVKVDLSKAKTPAPSLTAISWLETSIRSYAKFIEVASKTATAGNDEAEFVRQERMRIGEIRALLEEMKDAGKVDKGA